MDGIHNIYIILNLDKNNKFENFQKETLDFEFNLKQY